MNAIKKEDLKKGDYFKETVADRVYLCFIAEISQRYIDVKRESYHIHGVFATISTCTTLTQEEKNWLDACMKAGEFVPLSEINNQITYECY